MKELDGTLLPLRMRIFELVRICKDFEDITIKPYCGLRTCAEQAKLFRQSRTTQEVQQKAQSLRDKGYDFLAEALLAVGPQPGQLGRHVTMAGPGESWHQYGEAADCVPIRLGKAVWDDKDPAWQVYGEAAGLVGLTWSGGWKRFKEMPHVQLSQQGNPLSGAQPEDIKRRLVAVNSLTL